MISKDKCLCFPWITYRHLPQFGYIRPSISKLTYNLLLLVEILVRGLGRYLRKITTPLINNYLANREIVINFRGWLMRHVLSWITENSTKWTEWVLIRKPHILISKIWEVGSGPRKVFWGIGFTSLIKKSSFFSSFSSSCTEMVLSS